MSETIRKLSVLDSAFLFAETAECPMHVGSLTIVKLPDGYEGDFYEDFKTRIASRLGHAKSLRWKLAQAPFDIDRPSWVEDDQFDLDRHVLRGALPEPHDRLTAERIAGWLHAKTLNRARPLWEIYVFDGMPDNEAAIYSKMHHALIDGGAGAALTEILYEASPHPQTHDAPPPASVLLDAAIHQVEWPLRLAANAGELASVYTTALTNAFKPDSLKALDLLSAPSTPINAAISSERSFAGITVPMNRVKAVAAAAGGKVNDVVLALSSGMLRRYLGEQEALPKKSLTAFVPISAREKGDAELKNQVFGMVVALATDVEDPKTRLETIVAGAATSKELANPFRSLVPHLADVPTFGSPMLLQLLAVFYGRSRLADSLPPPMNVVVSNVLFSRAPIYIAGARILHVYPMSIPVHGQALNITVHGYVDGLDFGLIAAANVVPNVHELADMLPLELVELERAYGLAA